MLEIDHMINYIPALQTLVDEENMSKTVGTQVGTQDLTDPTTPSLTNTGTPSGGEKQNIQRQRRSEKMAVTPPPTNLLHISQILVTDNNL